MAYHVSLGFVGLYVTGGITGSMKFEKNMFGALEVEGGL